ncbi:MAG: hypothetical protein ACE5H9_09005 [Anaerolineae bacterium]
MDLDALSLFIGALMGLMLGWALTRGAVMRQKAEERLGRASKTHGEMELKKEQSKKARRQSVRANLQSAFYRAVGFAVLLMLVFFFFHSIAG